jgi:hypothetical protein
LLRVFIGLVVGAIIGAIAIAVYRWIDSRRAHLFLKEPRRKTA